MPELKDVAVTDAIIESNKQRFAMWAKHGKNQQRLAGDKISFDGVSYLLDNGADTSLSTEVKWTPSGPYIP
jgi:hypothetical protein